MSSLAKKSTRVVFSGIQPTGKLHLGNYLGAIKNWVNLQNLSGNDGQIFFSIVDLHALTTKYDFGKRVWPGPENRFDRGVGEDSLSTAIALLAAGVDLNKANMYIQSTVPYHTELCWLISCLCPKSWLNKMVQYKEKKELHPSLGIYIYPVLMAADIMLFK